MAAKCFTWTLCFALFLGVCGHPIKTGNTHGQKGGSSQSDVGFDVSASGQQNPVHADQKLVYHDPPAFAQFTDPKSEGSLVSDQVAHSPSFGNHNQAGSQQGLGANAQALSGSNTGAFPHASASMYGSFPSYGSQALGVGPATDFKGGELSTEDGSVYYGNYKSETEEQGARPHPPAMFAVGAVSQPRLEFGGALPYYYDYRFLTGQYPRGTYTHSSVSHSHGFNDWQDAHYVRDYYATQPEGNAQTSSHPVVPNNVEPARKQQNPLVYQDSAPLQQVPHQKSVSQQGFYRVQTPGQFGGMVKV